MNKLSDLCHNILVMIEEKGDLCHIYTGKYYFMIQKSGLDSLRYGLEAHYKHTELLFGFSDEELTILQKKRPKRSAIDEIDYQIDRKSYNKEVIAPSDLISRCLLYTSPSPRD